MPNFIENHKRLTVNLREGEHIDVEFAKNPDADHVTAFHPGCAACTVLYDFPDKMIFRYTAEEIPPQVYEAGMNQMSFTKSAEVTFLSGAKEDIYVSGIVIPKNG